MSIKLINQDVAFKVVTSPRDKGRIIQVADDPDDTVIFGEVVAVSDEVTEVKVGDVVFVPWPKATPTFEAPVGGVETGIKVTSIKEILGVVDDY